jgi:hypothetical protein
VPTPEDRARVALLVTATFDYELSAGDGAEVQAAGGVDLSGDPANSSPLITLPPGGFPLAVGTRSGDSTTLTWFAPRMAAGGSRYLIDLHVKLADLDGSGEASIAGTKIIWAARTW